MNNCGAPSADVSETLPKTIIRMKVDYLKRMKALMICLAMTSPAISANTVKSPDGNISMNFRIDNGIPIYSVSYKGHTAVKDSRLGLELKDDNSLMDGFELVGTETSSFDETWYPVWGEVNQIRNHYNEYLAKLRQVATDRLMNIRFRVYDDGIGFRYEFPQQKNLVYFYNRKNEMYNFCKTKCTKIAFFAAFQQFKKSAFKHHLISKEKALKTLICGHNIRR